MVSRFFRNSRGLNESPSLPVPVPVSHPPITRFEVTCVYAPPDATVDIVLVHGLNGHPEKTWTAPNGVFWPTELLPPSLKGAKARILVYGYNADVFAFGDSQSASSDMIHQHAQTLLSGLAIERESEDCGENPIIWVVHSLGGILLKRALLLSNDLVSKNADRLRSIFVSTYGIIFLGTPHNGAEPAKWGLILQNLADLLIPKKLMDTEQQLVRTLKSNNEILQNINLHFMDIYERFQIEMVHESVKTDLKGLKIFIVDQASASPQLPHVNYYGIEASHVAMCKFESKTAPGYLNVSTTIRRWVLAAPPVIQSRWEAEQKSRREARELQAKELLYPAGPPGPSKESSMVKSDLSKSDIMITSIPSLASYVPENIGDTAFIKPPGFRPNSLFVGRKAELDQLHKMLFDKKRRAEGTSAVLLHCLPGGGKSCLARQYVFTHLKDYPGGIFWVGAKSQEQLAAGFWDIARKVALKPSNIDGNIEPPRDAQQFISEVTEWFSTHHDWLLVLDGIQFDHSEELLRFIPDSKNTSLIYTSTQRSVAGDHHFVNPQIIRIPLLSAREAQELFLAELNKENPTLDDLKHSMDLVQRMGFLPLVIHTVARRLKATDEPLAKFARSYLSGPKLRDLDNYKAVVDQLRAAGSYEALNLMNVVCFFSQHIPVEMLSLGLTALDVPTKARERGNDPALNSTIKMLNKFALIERRELDPLRSSQSSAESREFLSDGQDVIKLHSVVQDFFLDSLRAERHLSVWLERAALVFRRSYEIANTRIYRKTNKGLVNDYRLYEIHGKLLLEHLNRHEKKNPPLDNVRLILEPTLDIIKGEIERRTRESSYGIAQGREDAYLTSIFDRTSSSSDTGIETPQEFVYAWGPLSQVESPVSLTHERDVTEIIPFPSMPKFEDPGYDSDREEAASMTARASQRTPRPDGLSDSEDDWQAFRGRKTREMGPPLDLHRTVKAMEKNRYHDSAGAWRAVNPPAADPRVSRELAEAFIPRLEPSLPSRGRMSGQSQAEVALSQINKNSPPPTRGGGHIQVRDRSHSSQPRRSWTERGYLLAGNVSYAPVQVGDSAFSQSRLGGTRSRSTSGPSLRIRPATPAVDSLEKFAYSIDKSRLPTFGATSSQIPDRRPPYPIPSKEGLSRAGRENEGNVHSTSLPVYPTQTGRPPAGYVTGWHSGEYNGPPSPSETTFPPPSVPETSRWLHDQTNRLGVFKSDKNDQKEAGYTSQPMSRDPSGGSGRGISPASLVETEPPPDLPMFSPRIGPTSYERHENMRELEGNLRSRKSPRLEFARAALLERREQSDDQMYQIENETPLTRTRTHNTSTFNPTAPVFLPRARSQPHDSSFSLFPSSSRPRRQPSPLGSPFRAQILDKPLPPFPPPANPHQVQYQSQYQPRPGASSVPMSRTASGSNSGSGSRGSPGLNSSPGRSSGGVRVGSRMIAFGDYPELVDSLAARERAGRQLADLDDARRSRVRRGAAGASRAALQGEERMTRSFEGIGTSGRGSSRSLLVQGRAVSDIEYERERNQTREGGIEKDQDRTENLRQQQKEVTSPRKRGLSSPERETESPNDLSSTLPSSGLGINFGHLEAAGMDRDIGVDIGMGNGMGIGVGMGMERINSSMETFGF